MFHADQHFPIRMSSRSQRSAAADHFDVSRAFGKALRYITFQARLMEIAKQSGTTYETVVRLGQKGVVFPQQRGWVEAIEFFDIAFTQLEGDSHE